MRTTAPEAAASVVLLLLLALVPAAATAQAPHPSAEPVATATPAPSVEPTPGPAGGPSAGGAIDTSGSDPVAAGPAAAGPQPDVTLTIVPGATRTLVVSIKLPTTDPGGAGIKGWYVSQNPATPALGANGWKGIKPSTFTLTSGEGVRTLYAWAKTKSGVISDRSSDTVLIDRTPPTVTLDAPTDAAARTITISLDEADPLSGGSEPASGVTRWAVVTGTTAPGRYSTAWKSVEPSTFKLPTGNGIKTVSAFARDAAGNVSAPSTATVTLTVLGPTVTLTVPSASARRAVPVTLRATDPGGTGIAGYHLSQDGTAPGPSATWALLPTTFTVTAGDGPKTIHAWVKDKNGTISARVSATTTVDTTLPTVTMSAAATTTTVSLPVTLDATDTGSGISAWAVVNGTAVPATASAAWQATKPAALVLSLGNGTKTFTAFARDAAGNISAAVTRTTVMTLPAPSLTFSVAELTRTTTPPVTVTPTDPGGTGIAGYFLSESPSTPAVNATGWAVFPSSTTLTNVQGTHTVYAWLKDRNGSISARRQDATFLDSVRPAVALTAPAATKASTIVITIDATDTGGSGVTRWAIVAGTNPPATGFPEWKATPPTSFTLSPGDGSKTISAFARDAAGNVSVAATRVVIVDNVRPTVTLSAPSATATRPISVTVTGADGTGSGISAWALVDGTTAPVAGSAAWVAGAPTTWTLPAVDAHKTISAFARDAAGNVSLAGTTQVVLDTTSPSVWLTTPTWYNGATPWVALDGDDSGGTGIAEWAVVAGTTQPGPGSAAWVSAEPSSVTVAAGDGAKTVSAWSRDAVGNVSAIHTRTITIDTVAPTVTLGSLPAQTATRTIAVSLDGADDASGVYRWAVTEGTNAPSFGSSSWKSAKPTQYTISGADGTRTIRAWTRDTAGNVSTAAVRTTFMDTTGPTITFTAPAVSTVRGITLGISGTDAGTGIADWAVVQGTAQPAAGDAAWVAAPSTSWTLPAAEGSTQITAFSRDLVGNVGSVTRTVILDTTDPSATLSVVTPAATRTVSITVGGSDGAAGSGIASYAVVEGTTAPAAGSGSWVSSPPTTIGVSLGDGTKSVSAFTRDQAGHVSAAATKTVVIDSVDPSATLGALAPTRNRTIAVTVGGSDNGGGVGIASHAIVEGTAAPAPGSGAWVASAPTSFQVSATDGTKTVSAFTRDAAGNVSAPATRTVLLDTSRPTATLTAPATTPTQLITVTVAGTDAGSGITAWAVTEGTLVPAGDSTKWVASPPTSITLSAAAGDKQATAFTRDAAGNVSVGATRTVTLQSP